MWVQNGWVPKVSPHSLGPIHSVIRVTRQQGTVIPLHGLGQVYCFCGSTRVIRWQGEPILLHGIHTVHQLWGISRVWSIMVYSKVTHCLGCTRLDEAVHPWSLPSGGMTCCLLFLYPPNFWSTPASWAPATERPFVALLLTAWAWVTDRPFAASLSLRALFWMVAAQFGGNQSGHKMAAWYCASPNVLGIHLGSASWGTLSTSEACPYGLQYFIVGLSCYVFSALNFSRFHSELMNFLVQSKDLFQCHFWG